MNRFRRHAQKMLKNILSGFLFAVYLASPSLVGANPGELSSVPLFLEQPVQPNIFIVLDDSGSMRTNDVTRNPNSFGGQEGACRNLLAYDPSFKYTPWKGTDAGGNEYANQQLGAARVYPWRANNYIFRNSDSDKCRSVRSDSSNDQYMCDLRRYTTTYVDNDGDTITETIRGARWISYTDANGNGKLDDDECDPLTENGGLVFTDGGVFVTTNVYPDVTDLPATTSVGDAGYPNSQQNYANWFTYYRTSELVAKRAISEVIMESEERIGLGGLNYSSTRTSTGTTASTKGREVVDVDDIPYDEVTPSNNDARTNAARVSKEALLQNLFTMVSSGGTPLRRALDNAGRYYRGVSQSGVTHFTSSASSPILSAAEGGECQQNFTLLFSDGERNGSLSGTAGNADGDGNTAYDGDSYADNFSNTLADFAMKYYEIDMDSTLDNKVPANSLGRNREDDNSGQHMVTYTISFGLSGNAVDPATEPADASPAFAWPASVSVDDMYHAAWNGRGDYLQARNADELITLLQAAIADIQGRSTSSAAAVAVNSTNFINGGKLYQAGFDSVNWSGSITAFNLDSSGAIISTAWAGHDELDNRDLAASPRNIVTYNGTNGIVFAAPASYSSPNASSELSVSQIADLLSNAPNNAQTPIASTFGLSATQVSDNQTFVEDIVKFHKGFATGLHTSEGDDDLDFRSRNSQRFGDVVHSSPVYVGAPDATTYPPGIELSSYVSWAANAAQTNRTPLVYVGSNDGMLHAFDASNGTEVFSYIPGLVFSEGVGSGMSFLANQLYEHQFYVDQTVAVGDAYTSTPSDNSAAWRTILIGALGAGGEGVYAIDVTNPSDIADSTAALTKVMWEFSNPNMGHTVGQPTITKLSNGEWAAVVANGYNASDSLYDGHARLFIIRLSDGSVIKEIDTGEGANAVGDCSDCNGLSSPTVIDLNNDGIGDRVYAGDVQGNLWKFDISNASTSSWSATKMFTATNNLGDAQPITGQVAVVKHPTKKTISTEPNTLVLFGTGQFVAQGDSATTDVQSFYGVWDDGSTGTAFTRSNLVAQTISESTITSGGSSFPVRTMSNNNVNYDVVKGWYMDFNISLKERVIVRPILFGDVVVFVTLAPNTSLCDSAGTSWFMTVDYLDGSEPEQVVQDVNSDGLFNAQDQAAGANVAGTTSSELFWQPSILEGGLVLVPDDTGVEVKHIRGTKAGGARSSWIRYDF